MSNSQGYLDPVYATPIALGLFDLVMPTTKDFTADAICQNYPNATDAPNPSTLKPFASCNKTLNSLHLERLSGNYSHPVFGNMTIVYNETAEDKFRFVFGEFGRGVLCQIEDSPTRFRIYYDPQGPYWFYNNEVYSIATQSEIYFHKDIGGRGTYVNAPWLEKTAPNIKSQTFFKVDYSPCQPSMCLNGGTCTPKGDYDYQCSCPSLISGVNCEIGIE